MNLRNWLLALLVGMLSASMASSQDTPLVTINDLGVSVRGAKVVPNVKGLMGNKLVAKAGNKLAVVSLSGTAQGKCSLKLDPSEFSAVYLAAAPSSGGGTESAVAGAVGSDGMWLFAEGIGYTMTENVPKAGPFQFELAISVSQRVNEFSVQWRGTPLGKAILTTEPQAGASQK